MTVSGDFIPAEENQAFESGPTYPVAFGIELNPKVQGIGAALVGIVGSVFLYTRVVQPAQETKASLEASIADKTAQLARQEASLRKIEEVQAALDAVVKQRAEIYSLLGEADSLDTLLLDINQQIKSSSGNISGLINRDLDGPLALNQRLSAVGFNSEQIQALRSDFISDPIVRAYYQPELRTFTPDLNTSGVISDGKFGAVLDGKLEQQVVNVELEALYPQTQAIIRSLERLEPLLIVKDFKQEISALPDSVAAVAEAGPQFQALFREFLARRLKTSFTLEVLVPTGGPGDLPAPPPAEEQPAEGG